MSKKDNIIQMPTHKLNQDEVNIKNFKAELGINTDKQTEDFFTAFFKGLKNNDTPVLQEADCAELASLMALPDAEFNMLSEMFLAEFENILQNSTDRILLAEALKTENLTVQDVEEIYDQAIYEIDNSMTNIDQSRRDFLKRFLNIYVTSIEDIDNVPLRRISIPCEICRDGAKVPTYANETDAGMDIYSPDDYTIHPGETVIIPIGIKVALPKGYALTIQPRSGQSVKTKLRVANSPGLIDCGYRDEIGVIVENIEPKITDITYENEVTKEEIGLPTITSVSYGRDFVIEKGQRFAQMKLEEVPTAAFYTVENISEVEGVDRGGGFGHTGVK